MGKNASHESHGHHEGPHIVPLSLYFTIFAILMVLTAVTVAVAFVDLGLLNNVVALGIACTKATLVLLYFMHLRYVAQINRIAVVVAVLSLAVMGAFTFGDYLSRSNVVMFPTHPMAAPAHAAEPHAAAHH